VYAGDYSPYRRRVHGRPPLGIGGSRFVVFLQNHDQVGNRATGDRITHLPAVRESPGRAKIGAALTLLSPFVPMLFQGEEWAASSPFLYFTDHRDPELGAAVSEGRRREFGSFGWAPEDVPDPQDRATFERSKLDWGEVSQPEHASMLAWYRDLISLRRRLPELSDGRREAVEVSCDEAQGWLVVSRGTVTVAANFGTETVTRPVTPSGSAAGPSAAGGSGAAPAGLLASESGVVLADGGVVLPPDSVAVVSSGAERFAT
jgi:maltooligosyltrehalose trehalohydrolase